MKRFSFRLDPLLRLRKQAEQQALEAFARELTVRSQLEAELRETTTLLDAAAAATAIDAGTRIDAVELALRQAYVERRERERADAQARVAAQEERLDAQRQRLEECARDRRVVERLRDRAWARHEREEAQRQNALVDDLATSAYARKTRAVGA